MTTVQCKKIIKKKSVSVKDIQEFMSIKIFADICGHTLVIMPAPPGQSPVGLPLVQNSRAAAGKPSVIPCHFQTLN